MAKQHAQSKDQDIYRAASRAVEQDPNDEWPEYAKRKLPKKLFKVVGLIIVVLILAGVGYAGYKSLKHHKPAAKTSAAINQPRPANSGSNSGTQTYTASGSDLNLSFSYPSSWTVSPASSTDTTNQTISINSPSMTIGTASGTNVTGKATVLIRAGGSNLSELNSGNPTAALDSTQFAYTTPTANQHNYAYLTFIQLSSNVSTPGAFNEVMVTGIQPFTKGEQVSPADLSQLDPIISATFYKCNDTTCAGQGGGLLSINNDSWQNSEPFTQVQTLFASLKFN